MIYFITYILFFENGNTKKYVERFAYYPSQHDINEVGGELVVEYNAVNFCASRGKKDWNGEWIDNE